MWNILVADDENIERMIVKKVLTDCYGDGCRVFDAVNGREAAEIAEREDIHIAVLDICMPAMNGIEAARAIKRLRPDCAVLFLSAYDDFQYARAALAVRAVDYLLKPCADKELINAMDAAARVFEASREYRLGKAAMRGQGGGAFCVPTDGDAESSGNAGNFGTTGNPGNAGERDEDAGAQTAMEIISFIRENYHRDLSLSEAAGRVNFSEPYFCKFFKSTFSVTFTSYLTGLRIDEAMRLLKETGLNVREIGARVGYPEPNYFAKVFRRTAGMSPSDYRAKHGGGACS